MDVRVVLWTECLCSLHNSCVEDLTPILAVLEMGLLQTHRYREQTSGYQGEGGGGNVGVGN